MTNKERYKQAFSALHTTEKFSLEAAKMEKARKQHKLQRLVAAVAVCATVAVGATAAYAADVGGVQRTIQLWVHGDQTEAAIQFDGAGGYSMEYSDSEGNPVRRGGGGVTFSADGTKIPVSEEDLMKELTAPEVRYEDDGSVWVYWYGQKVDITDKVENGVCYVLLDNGEETLYMTVKYQKDYATSPHKYLSPSTFGDGE